MSPIHPRACAQRTEAGPDAAASSVLSSAVVVGSPSRHRIAVAHLPEEDLGIVQHDVDRGRLEPLAVAVARMRLRPHEHDRRIAFGELALERRAVLGRCTRGPTEHGQSDARAPLDRSRAPHRDSLSVR